jgi:hypothetical protein
MKNIDKVRQFMVTFGQETNYDIVPEAIERLRRDLIEEELTELENAETIVDVADALTDLEYVILGAMIIYKKDYSGFVVTDTEAKPFICEDALALGISSIWASLAEPDFAEWLHSMMVDVHMMAAECNIPIQSCFDEVHRSNMSKAGPDGKPIYREDGKVLKGPNYFPPNLGQFL